MYAFWEKNYSLVPRTDKSSGKLLLVKKFSYCLSRLKIWFYWLELTMHVCNAEVNLMEKVTSGKKKNLFFSLITEKNLCRVEGRFE